MSMRKAIMAPPLLARGGWGASKPGKRFAREDLRMDHQEKNVVASLALHAVLEPVFTEVSYLASFNDRLE